MQCVTITLPIIFIKYKKLCVPPVRVSDVGRMPVSEQNVNINLIVIFLCMYVGGATLMGACTHIYTDGDIVVHII